MGARTLWVSQCLAISLPTGALHHTLTKFQIDTCLPVCWNDSPLRGRGRPPACWWQTAFDISGLGSYWSTALVVCVSVEVVAAWAYSTLQLSSHLRSGCLCSVLVESWRQSYRLVSLCFRKRSFFQQQVGLCAYQVILFRMAGDMASIPECFRAGSSSPPRWYA